MKYSLILQKNSNFEIKNVYTIKSITPYLFVCLFMFLGYLIGVFSEKPTNIEKLVYSEKFLVQKYNEPFSEDVLKHLLTKLKVKNADIVLAQAKAESGHFSSNVFYENNNLFGMKPSNTRITTCIGENRGFAVYDTWQDSVLDYALYQTAYLRNKSRAEYIAYLKANYTPDAHYVGLLKKLTKK